MSPLDETCMDETTLKSVSVTFSPSLLYSVAAERKQDVTAEADRRPQHDAICKGKLY